MRRARESAALAAKQATTTIPIVMATERRPDGLRHRGQPGSAGREYHADRARILDFAAMGRFPAIYGLREFVESRRMLTVE